MKKCIKCGEEKPKNEFYKNKNIEDGCDIYCKTCRQKMDNLRKPKYYIEHKEKIHKRQRKWYLKNKDRLKIKKFLYGKQTKDGSLYESGLLCGAGCCLICFQTHPFVLSEHHPFKENKKYKITLCENCHHVADHYPSLLPMLF